MRRQEKKESVSFSMSLFYITTKIISNQFSNLGITSKYPEARIFVMITSFVINGDFIDIFIRNLRFTHFY